MYEGMVHAALGDTDRAVGLVRKALRLGLSRVVLRDTGWELQRLRGHPQFDELFPHPTF
jgi:hypothetical protein